MKRLPTHPLSNRALLCAFLVLGAFYSTAASSQAMRDPTRPPVQFLDPADVADEAMAPASGLQTIKRTGKRRVALLHGEWVKPGDKFGEAVVEKIDDQSVTLHHPDGRRETIRMYPEVDVQSSRTVKRMAGR